jgi:hypothetical protein
VEPAVVREIRQYTDRLHIDLQGEPLAVRQWLEAIRTGETLPGLRL